MVEVRFFGTTQACGSPRTVDPSESPTLLEITAAAGLLLGRSCGARGICRSCSVTVRRGLELLTPIAALEAKQRLPANQRLACQAAVHPAASGVVELAHPAWGR